MVAVDLLVIILQSTPTCECYEYGLEETGQLYRSGDAGRESCRGNLGCADEGRGQVWVEKVRVCEENIRHERIVLRGEWVSFHADNESPQVYPNFLRSLA